MSWRYYNRALIPTTPPHVEVDISSLDKGVLWRKYSKALFARWTTDFDTDRTEWWFCIKDDPIDLQKMKSKKRRKITSSLEKCYVKPINPSKYLDSLYHVYTRACSRYKNFSQIMSMTEFESLTRKYQDVYKAEYWAVFNRETNKLIGYRSCIIYDEYVDFATSKFDPEELSNRPAEALTYEMVNHYMSKPSTKYILAGERTILHATNIQDFYIEHFGFRRAYCKLHIRYRPLVKLLIGFLYPLRGLIRNRSGSLIDKVKSVLLMEEIVRTQHN